MKTLMTGVIAMCVGLGAIQGASAKESTGMTVQNVRYTTENPKDVRSPAVFKLGEVVYLRFAVDGMKRVEGKVWGQEDLTVRGPNSNIILLKNRVLDAKLPLDNDHLFSATNDITLPGDATVGKYTIHVVIRDMYAKDLTEFDESFDMESGKTKGKK